MIMKITDVRMKKVKGENVGKLRAYVDITFDEALVIHGIKLIEGENGIFVAMPSRKMHDNEYKDIVHPISSDLRKEITEALVKHYEELEDVE